MHNFFLLFFLGRLAKILVGKKSMIMKFLIITLYNDGGQVRMGEWKGGREGKRPLINTAIINKAL